MSAATGNRRPRPVITVVDARPLNEVSFRGPPTQPVSSQTDDNVKMRQPPKRPGAPPSRPPSIKLSEAQSLENTTTLQPPVPVPRTSINQVPPSPRPRSSYKPINNSTENSTEVKPPQNLIHFDIGKTEKPTQLYPQLPTPDTDDQPVYATINKIKKTDVNQNISLVVKESEYDCPPIPHRNLNETLEEPASEKRISFMPTPLAFLHNANAGNFPVLRKAVHSESDDEKTSDESSKAGEISQKSYMKQGIPVLPMAGGVLLRKTTTNDGHEIPTSTRPMSLGIQPSVKPKPNVKPKPAVKPKPPVMQKPGFISAPTTPSDLIGSNKLHASQLEVNSVIDRPQSMMVLPSSHDDDDEVKQATKDQETSVANIMNIMKARFDNPQTENHDSGRPKPVKATYRPTIIRPQAEKHEEYRTNVESILPCSDDTAADQNQAKPASVVRNRPTIIRAHGASQRASVVTNTNEQDQVKNQFKQDLEHRLSLGASMPNLVTQSRTDVHNSSSNEAVGIYEPISDDIPSRSPTMKPRTQSVSEHPPPSYSPPPDYEEIHLGASKQFGGSAQNLSLPPPRPSALPRGDSSDPARKSGPPPRPSGLAAPTRSQAGPLPSKSQLGPVNQQAGPLPVKTPVTGTRSRGPCPSLPERPGPGHPLFHYVVSEPHAIAVYDYDGSHADELSFKSGEVIILMNRVSDDWFLGRCSGREGIFPASFVDVVKMPEEKGGHAPTPKHIEKKSSPPTLKASHGSGPRCVARFDYDGDEADDLTFQAEDVIKLLEVVEDEWYRGELNSKTGIFPASYVEVIEALPPVSLPHHPSPAGSDTTVRAIHDFKGEAGELTFKTGASIQILSQVNADWLFGQCEGHTGNFPSTFVDRIPNNLPQKEQRSVSPATLSALKQPQCAYCIAIYDYDGDSPDDLHFKKDNTIELLEHVGEDWLRGKIGNQSGLFPRSFVEIFKDIDELPPRPLNSSTMKQEMITPKAVAKFTFTGEASTDLSFSEGEEIILLKKLDEDWFEGRIKDKVGMFPSGYVEILVPL